MARTRKNTKGNAEHAATRSRAGTDPGDRIDRRARKPDADDLHYRSVEIHGDGVRLHAIVAGPEQGPLVILLHGFPEMGSAWHSQIDALAAAGLRVLAPDQRGYGLSDKPQDVSAYVIDLLVRDVLCMADAMGRERFAVVGHDWGGALAWLLAQRHPDRVARAVVLNGPHPATVWRHTIIAPSQLLKSAYIGFFQFPLLPEWTLRTARFAWLRYLLAATSRPGTFSEEEWRRYGEAWAQPGALSSMLNWYRALPLGVRIDAAPIEVPVRIIWGDQDDFMDAGLAEKGLALCRSGEVFHFPEATHWVHHEHAGEVNRLLVEFLAQERF